jgi:hypothetical protein
VLDCDFSITHEINPSKTTDCSVSQRGMLDSTGRTEEQVSKEHAPIDTLVSTTKKDMSVAHIATAMDNNQAPQLSEKTDQQHHPFPLLTFLDPAPTQESSAHHGDDRPLTNLSPPSPSALEVPQLIIKEVPTFNPAELHQAIFPTELPPRPSPKRSLFACMFKRQEQTADDIELCSQGSPRVLSYLEQLQRRQHTGNWGAICTAVLFLGVVGLSGWFLMSYRHDKPGNVQIN